MFRLSAIDDALFRPFTEAGLLAAKPHIFGVKLYPQGATTNSEAGVKELREAEPTLEDYASARDPIDGARRNQWFCFGS